MATIADELNAISVEHGYTGAAPKTIAGAIDALADTLAGTDVEERRTIADAVKALAPYIGSGGGGAALGAGVGVFVVFGGGLGAMPAASHVTVMNGDAVMMDCTTEDGFLTWHTPDGGGLIIPSGESLTTIITFSDGTAASIDSVISAKVFDANEAETDYVVTHVLSSDKKTLSITIPAIPQSGFELVVVLRGGVN